MSPHAVNSLVTDLVQMAKAMEELPAAQDRIQNLLKANDSLHESIQVRELAIIAYKNTIAGLEAKVSNLEVARDDAELRFLELDDRAGKALALVNQLEGFGHQVVALLKAQTIEPVAAGAHSEDGTGTKPYHELSGYNEPQSSEVAPLAVDPTPSNAETGETGGGNQSQSNAQSVERHGSTEGQSEVPPTVTIASPTAAQFESPIVTSDHASEPVPVSADKGPYHGKLYWNLPGYISFHDWLDGGGTEQDYRGAVY